MKKGLRNYFFILYLFIILILSVNFLNAGGGGCIPCNPNAYCNHWSTCINRHCSGTCSSGYSCIFQGEGLGFACICQPSCSCSSYTCVGYTCSNGCGGSCSGTKTCCTPNCTGKECGSDGCSGICGQNSGNCGSGEVCSSGQCRGNCSVTQGILKLSGKTNATAALWNDTSDGYSMCFDNLFGFDFLSSNTHNCTGENIIIKLSNVTNALAETKTGTNYPINVCYGNLVCRSVDSSISGKNCSQFERNIFSLDRNTNARISIMNDSNYPIKICCRAKAFSEIRFEDLLSEEIEEAEIGDSVKLVAEVSGVDLSDQNITYKVYKTTSCTGVINCVFSLFSSDKKVAQFSNKAFTIWRTNQTGDFYFSAETEDENLGSSDILEVISPANDYIPQIKIVKPEMENAYPIDATTLKTTNISFEQISKDEDDDLNITWDFGDSQTARFTNCMSGGNCNTTHYYTASGTKIIIATAKESYRGISSKDYTMVFTYKEGLNIFAIIDKPNYIGILKEPGSYELNGKSSHVAECSLSETTCETAAAALGTGETCYEIRYGTSGLYCYKLVKSDRLTFTWTVDNVIDTTHITDEPFYYLFRQRGDHTIKLKVSYSTEN